jgi:hypothetical protein
MESLLLESSFVLESDEPFASVMEVKSKPSRDANDDPDFRRMSMYARADSELKKLWQVPRKRADLNLSVDCPSTCWNGTDTRGCLSWCHNHLMQAPTSFLRHGP